MHAKIRPAQKQDPQHIKTKFMKTDNIWKMQKWNLFLKNVFNFDKLINWFIIYPQLHVSEHVCFTYVFS